MTTTIDAATMPYELVALSRSLERFRTVGRVDTAFGGRIVPGASTLQITQMTGTRTQSVAGLVVRNGAGIGGKSLELGRPVSVSNYLSSEGITHAYDHAVRPEALETVAVLPVIVDRIPRLMIYLAVRAQVGLGDRWFDSFGPLMRRLERDIAVDDEVRRRLAAMQAAQLEAQSSLSRSELREMADELAGLADQIADAKVAAKVDAVRRRCADASTPTTRTPAVQLSPREVTVLEQVALGLSNRDVADALGLLPNTVKSYMKTASRKLHASNRVQAILAARAAGVID